MEFTPRNVAKVVVTTLVSRKVGMATQAAIADYSRFDEDNLVVEVTGGLVGWYVSAKLKPITDNVVDKTADFINTKRGKPNPEKDPEEK